MLDLLSQRDGAGLVNFIVLSGQVCDVCSGCINERPER